MYNLCVDCCEIGMALFLIIYIWKLLINDSPSRSLLEYLPWQFSFSKLLYQFPLGITFYPVRQFTFSHRLPHSIAVETISLSCLSPITFLAIFASLFVLFSSPESVTATSHHACFRQEPYWTNAIWNVQSLFRSIIIIIITTMQCHFGGKM